MSMEQSLQRAFNNLFYPESVAVFGSAKKNKIAHQIITQMISGKFAGKIYSINPKAEKPEGFSGIPALPSIMDIEGGVDLAVIAVPAPYVETVLRNCGERKISVAVVITSGFSEVGNTPEEERLKETAGEYGIRLIGPNCAGIMNTTSSLFASIEVHALPGTTAFITQSGAIGGAVLASAETRGIGFSKFVSYGNRADIGEVELLNYLQDDPQTLVIAMYLESLNNGKDFMEAVERVSSVKPVVVVKSGRSSSGLRAAPSHTGALAGSDEIFEAMARQTGIVRVPGIEELLDLCEGFSTLPPLKGEKIAIVTNSGGPGILTSDRAEELSLDVRPTDDKLKEKLKGFLPPHCSLLNPIDLTVEGTPENFKLTLQAVLEHGYNGAIVINVATPFLDSEAIADGIIEAAAGRKERKPVAAAFMAGKIVEKGIEKLRAGGIASFPTGERAVYTFAKMHQYYRKKRRSEKIKEPVSERLPLTSPILEPDLVKFLEKEGFPFPEHAFISSFSKLNSAASKIGFPTVMKIVSPEVIHKSDYGGVILNIETESMLEKAYRKMEERFSQLEFKGVMLYRQIERGFEFIAGIKRDPCFGAVVLAGAGGIFTEIIKDSSIRIAPFDIEEAINMLSELKIGRVFSAFRGDKPRDKTALAELLVKLSELSLKYPGIEELDLNPVFVLEKGVVVGDVRIKALNDRRSIDNEKNNRTGT